MLKKIDVKAVKKCRKAKEKKREEYSDLHL